MRDIRQSNKGIEPIDPASRHKIVWFLARFLGFAAFALAPCVVSGRTLREAAMLLALACSLGGLVSMVFASLCREPFGRGSLNGWDEALAFVAASRLAHFASHFQA